MSAHLETLIAYNNWANCGLIGYLATLPPETLDLTTAGVYGTVGATLAHLLSSELSYQRQLLRLPHVDLSERLRHPDLAALQELARESSAQLASIAGSLPNPELMLELRHGQRAAGTVVTQLVTHAAEHRAHVGTILGAHVIQLPELDAWAYGVFAGHDDWPTDEWGLEPPDRQSARFAIR